MQGMLDLLILRVLRQGRLNGWDTMHRIQLVSGDILNVYQDRSTQHSIG
jgi:hypothetical protein